VADDAESQPWCMMSRIVYVYVYFVLILFGVRDIFVVLYVYCLVEIGFGVDDEFVVDDEHDCLCK